MRTKPSARVADHPPRTGAQVLGWQARQHGGQQIERQLGPGGLLLRCHGLQAQPEPVTSLLPRRTAAQYKLLRSTSDRHVPARLQVRLTTSAPCMGSRSSPRAGHAASCALTVIRTHACGRRINRSPLQPEPSSNLASDRHLQPPQEVITPLDAGSLDAEAISACQCARPTSAAAHCSRSLSLFPSCCAAGPSIVSEPWPPARCSAGILIVSCCMIVARLKISGQAPAAG